MSLTKQIDILWDYLCFHEPVKKAEIGIVFGSHDLKTAQYAADLYHQGYFQTIICTGALGRNTQGVWTEGEAQRYNKVLIANQVPRNNILLEEKATNSGENILFTKALLEEKKWDKKSLLLIHKPYMQRRLFTAFRKRWPEKENFSLTGMPLSFREYIEQTDDLSKEEVIAMLVGDLQRIMVYPEKGYQIEQDIPPVVKQSYEALIKAGYTQHLLS